MTQAIDLRCDLQRLQRIAGRGQALHVEMLQRGAFRRDPEGTWNAGEQDCTRWHFGNEAAAPAKTSSRVYLDDFSQRMKMRRPHDVPLSRQALVVLREVWELSYGNGIEHGLTEAYPALAK